MEDWAQNRTGKNNNLNPLIQRRKVQKSTKWPTEWLRKEKELHGRVYFRMNSSALLAENIRLPQSNFMTGLITPSTFVHKFLTVILRSIRS